MDMRLPLDPAERQFALPTRKAVPKRAFDLVVALAIAPLIFPAILVLMVLARYSTGESGLFRQKRIGLYGETFTLYKIRSMRTDGKERTHVTTAVDPRITRFGRFIRRTKMDEFPQLVNVIKGDMSFVGPRPDVAEMYANLTWEQKDVICVRPGITGPASITFHSEEALLGQCEDPERYNRDVIFPAKMKANLEYIANQSIILDVAIMFKTVFGRGR